LLCHATGGSVSRRESSLCYQVSYLTRQHKSWVFTTLVFFNEEIPANQHRRKLCQVMLESFKLQPVILNIIISSSSLTILYQLRERSVFYLSNQIIAWAGSLGHQKVQLYTRSSVSTIRLLFPLLYEYRPLKMLLRHRPTTSL